MLQNIFPGKLRSFTVIQRGMYVVVIYTSEALQIIFHEEPVIRRIGIHALRRHRGFCRCSGSFVSERRSFIKCGVNVRRTAGGASVRFVINLPYIHACVFSKLFLEIINIKKLCFIRPVGQSVKNGCHLYPVFVQNVRRPVNIGIVRLVCAVMLIKPP